MLLLVCLTMASINLFAQEKELYREDDGFKWYKIRQDGHFGAISKKGNKELIPLSREYDFICYHTTFGGGWFSVEKDGKHGACDKEGKEIVAPIKYDRVYYVQNSGNYKFCYVELNGKKGACDISGKEIIKPQYDNVVFLENDGYYAVELNGKKGACDMNGKEIIKPQYNSLFYSSSDHVFEYKDRSGNFVSTGIALADDRTGYMESSSNVSNTGNEPKQVAQKKEKKEKRQKKSFGEVMGIIADGLQVFSEALEGVNEALQPLAEQNNTYYSPQNNYNSSFENNYNYSNNNDNHNQRREERDKKADQMEWERRHGSSYQHTYNEWYKTIIDVNRKSTVVKNWEPDYRLKRLKEAQSKCKEIAKLYKEKSGHEIPCSKDLLNWVPSSRDLVGQ